MESKNKYAFTLVELIVVVTILAVLGTIAFMSLQGYSKKSRDSVRLTDMGSIKTSLDLFHLDAGKFPETTDGTSITHSGELAWTQGEFGESTFSNVQKLDKIPTDPLTDKKYIYSVTNTRQEYQIAGILELDTISINNIDNVFAGDKTATSIIVGNYNGQILKVPKGVITFILAVPSIIGGDITDLTVFDIIKNGHLIFNGFKNLPSNYRSGIFNPDGEVNLNLVNSGSFVVFSGAVEDLLNDSVQAQLIENLQNAYNFTDIITIDNIEKTLSYTDISSEGAKFIAQTIINRYVNSNVKITAKDINTPVARFIPSDDLTVVTDIDTGLIWQSHRDTNGDLPSLNEYDACDSSPSATYCSNLNLGGLNNWRLPTVSELTYLKENDNTLDTNYFSYIVGQAYFCSDGTETFSFINLFIPKANAMCTPFYVRCVHD